MSTRYTLNGIGPNVEFGKGGPRIKDNSGTLQARNNADSAYAELEVADPTGAQSATSKTYVDNLVNGLKWHAPVRVATTTAGTLSTDFENGDVVDGVTLATGNRILIKDQGNAENGIYVVNASGAPTRAADLDTGDAAANASVFVNEGTANADKGFTCTNDAGSDIVGTDTLVFTEFASTVGGVTSIQSVGTGVSLVEDGAAPVPDIRSIIGGTGIDASGATNEVTLAISNGGVDTAQLADEGVTEAKIAPLAAQHVRYVTYAFGDSSPKNIGSALPTNSRVLEVENHVTTAFTDAAATLEVGRTGAVGELQAATENNPARADAYFTTPGIDYASSTQLILTITPGTSTAGAGFVAVRFIHTL